MVAQRNRKWIFGISFTAFLAFLAMGIPTWIETVNHIAASILFVISGICLAVSVYFGYLLWKHRRDEVAAVPTAILELSEPELIPKVLTGYSYGGQAPTADLYRIKVTNKDYAQAENVKVSITEAQPHLDSLPMAFHRTHDNVPYRDEKAHYEQSWTLRPNEPLSLDVIAMDTDRKSLYLYRSDIGTSQIVYRLPQKSTPDPEHMHKEGFVFRMSIRANSPTEGIDQDYRAFVDEENRFRLEPIGRQHYE